MLLMEMGSSVLKQTKEKMENIYKNKIEFLNSKLEEMVELTNTNMFVLDIAIINLLYDLKAKVLEEYDNASEEIHNMITTKSEHEVINSLLNNMKNNINKNNKTFYSSLIKRQDLLIDLLKNGFEVPKPLFRRVLEKAMDYI